MEFGFTIAAYAVAGVLFILSLGGLSGQESAKRAVWYGIVGMAIAVLATLIGPGSGLWLMSLILIAAARRSAISSPPGADDPDARACGDHALAGRSCGGLRGLQRRYHDQLRRRRLCRGAGCWAQPARTGSPPSAGPRRSGTGCRLRQLIAKKSGVEIGILRVELVLGIWIGAVTFTGSVIAYGKLAGSLLPFRSTAAAKSCRAGTC
jgi:NAD(P) transhydrogenase subunit beta